MKNTYKNFENNIYNKLPYGYVPGTLHNEIFEQGVVDTYPDPEKPRGRQTKRRPLRICVYKDFKITETKNTHFGCHFTVTHIPTGEVILEDQMGLWVFEHFVWWYYNHK